MKNVLICDDSQWMRGLIRNELNKYAQEGKNHTVMEACNGKEALELLNRDRFDIAFLDWTMPLIDGLEVLKRLRLSSKHLDLKIVMITALSGKSDVMQALKEGVDDYITKPINSRQASARFKEALIDVGFVSQGSVL